MRKQLLEAGAINRAAIIPFGVMEEIKGILVETKVIWEQPQIVVLKRSCLHAAQDSLPLNRNNK